MKSEQFGGGPPEILIFAVTYRCNANCVMCTIGRRQKARGSEMTLDQIHKLVNEPIVRERITSVNITGGEPLLREDLLEVIALFVHHLRNLSSISINSNGLVLNAATLIRNIRSQTTKAGVLLNTYFSIDGIGKVHDTVRGVKDAYSRVLNTILELLRDDVDRSLWTVNLSCTITKHNWQSLADILSLAKDLGIQVDFTLAMETDLYMQNLDYRKEFALDAEAKERVAAFLTSLEKWQSLLNTPVSFYGNMAHQLADGRRRTECIFPRCGVFLEPDGSPYHCWGSSEFWLGNILKEPLERLWYSQRREKVLQLMRKVCSTCMINCYSGYKPRWAQRE